MDRPFKFTVTVECVINSSDGTRGDALSHLEHMLAHHGLEGIQMASLEPVLARIVRSGSSAADDSTFELSAGRQYHLR